MVALQQVIRNNTIIRISLSYIIISLPQMEELSVVFLLVSRLYDSDIFLVMAKSL